MSTAAAFRALHHAPQPLVLPNAWDAVSARLVEELGARAVATSSAALSWVHGAADGQNLDPGVLVTAVKEIVRVVRVPVTCDAEAGYGATLGEVGEVVARILDAGAVGVNLEDGRDTPEVLAGKIGEVKRVAARMGVDVYVNARTDVYLKELAPAAGAVDEVLRRARIYEAAGCDGLFVPGIVEEPAVRAVAAGAKVPLNVLAWRGLAPVAQLASWGVRRVSVGTGLANAALGAAKRAASELLERGTYDALFANAVATKDMNALFAPR
jgi:2-methylisocitrate lyase-like PEP mutase family enzyme